MLRGDSSRPETTQVMFEGFRLPHAAERVSLYGLDQEIDALEPGFVVLLKPEVVVPAFRGKEYFHSSINRLGLALPARKLLTELMRRSAFLGERSR